MSVASLTPRVRETIGVSSSYDDESIPGLIRRRINRLLRDYHFPKSVRRTAFQNLILNSQEYTLPTGFKKELAIRFYNPSDDSYSDPLVKTDGFRLPEASDGLARHYWLEGEKLHTSKPLPLSFVGVSLVVWHETMDAETNEAWMTVDFEDVLFSVSVARGAAEYRKPEVAQTFAPLAAEDIASLAIYQNELEWSNVVMMQREPRTAIRERYPA